jgi:hypothetical protein
MSNLAFLVEKYAIYVNDLGTLGVVTDETLYVRSKLQQLLDDTTNAAEASKYLAEVSRLDEALKSKAELLLRNLGTTLRHYRKVQPRPPSHWWWYLDKLVQPPPRRRKQTVAEV